MPGEPKKGQPTNSGIVTDKTGDRFIPESQRADGSTRKAIKIRPGFNPTEDVQLYRSRGVEARDRPRAIPGAAAASEPAPSAASNKNAKRREARKKAKAADDEAEVDSADKASAAAGDKKEAETEKNGAQAGEDAAAAAAAADPEVETAKKARNLKKKLRQARELQNKKEDGQALLPEQIAKVIKINELVRELEALGFDAEGEGQDDKAAGAENKG